MTKFIKKPLSILLAALMIVSLFAMVPVTASADVGDYVAEEDYLTFTAVEAGASVTLNVNSGSNLQYSLDGGELIPYTPGTRIDLVKGDSVSFRGKNTTFNSSNHVSIVGEVACSGNVMSLRLDDYDEVQGLSERCFSYMFKGCTGLTAAPELPETILEESCYDNMFNGCRSLTTAPELPSTTLAESCYSSMFNGCSSLTTAPELWSTTLAPYCYKSMFYGCGRLTTAPELWATSLAYSCYDSMFKNCTNLTTAPKLWATELAPYCYKSMFEGCSSIKLSEARIDKYRIPYIVSSNGNGTADSYASYMFYGTGGTFTGTPELNKTYYMYKNYDYTTTDGEGFFFDDAVEVGLDDALAEKNNYTSLCNFKLLGVQKKVESDELDSESKTDVRFVSVVNTDILKDADEYGYIFAKADNKEQARDNVDMIVSSNAKVLTVPCKKESSNLITSNTVSGDYGNYYANTNYKYVTATVNGIGDSTVAARFYVKKDDKYYYADYTNKDNETYTVCATAFSDLG